MGQVSHSFLYIFVCLFLAFKPTQTHTYTNFVCKSFCLHRYPFFFCHGLSWFPSSCPKPSPSSSTFLGEGWSIWEPRLCVCFPESSTDSIRKAGVVPESDLQPESDCLPGSVSGSLKLYCSVYARYLYSCLFLSQKPWRVNQLMFRTAFILEFYLINKLQLTFLSFKSENALNKILI